MPGMPVTMGEPMPGVVPNMPHGACSGCSAYTGTYSAAADPLLTYSSAIAGQKYLSIMFPVIIIPLQPHRLRDGSGFCGADMHLLKNIDLQKQCIGRSQLQDGEADAKKLQRYLMQSAISGTHY
ncbi:grancalcin isoform 1-T4 [Sarcoramphus papa]